MDWGSVPNWVTVVVALLGVSAGLWQYRQAQKWKRAEWIAQEVKDFLRDPAVSNALWMLDWKERSLPLLLPGGDPGKYFDYTEDMLVHALSSQSSPQTHDYSDSEISIRDSFDRLLGSLERFQNFADAHLVTKPELAPYLQYWLEIIGDRKNLQKAEKVRRRLWGYIDDYGYEGVQRLLKSFGYDIRP